MVGHLNFAFIWVFAYLQNYLRILRVHDAPAPRVQGYTPRESHCSATFCFKELTCASHTLRQEICYNAGSELADSMWDLGLRVLLKGS